MLISFGSGCTPNCLHLIHNHHLAAVPNDENHVHRNLWPTPSHNHTIEQLLRTLEIPLGIVGIENLTMSGTIPHPWHFIENLESGIKVANDDEHIEQDVAGDEVKCDIELGGRGAEERRGGAREEGVEEGVKGAHGGAGQRELKEWSESGRGRVEASGGMGELGGGAGMRYGRTSRPVPVPRQGRRGRGGRGGAGRHATNIRKRSVAINRYRGCALTY